MAGASQVDAPASSGPGPRHHVLRRPASPGLGFSRSRPASTGPRPATPSASPPRRPSAGADTADVERFREQQLGAGAGATRAFSGISTCCASGATAATASRQDPRTAHVIDLDRRHGRGARRPQELKALFVAMVEVQAAHDARAADGTQRRGDAGRCRARPPADTVMPSCASKTFLKRRSRATGNASTSARAH